jgi:glycosyltransferase involved in cell wall biosynthesis
MYRGLRAAVVVPAFNEEANLAATIASIPAFIDHVLVVDDGSHDATAAVAEQAGGAAIEVVRHRHNRGVGAAVVSGYRRALQLGCDVTLVMAGDGQMDPRDVPALLAPIVAGRADYVKGNRFAYPEVLWTMPRARLLGNVALSLLTRVTSGYRRLFDSQCGFTAVTRATLLALDLDGLFPRYGYPNDLLARLRVAGARVVDVPVRPIYGPAWRSGITLRTAIYPVLFVVVRSLLWRKWAERRASRLTRRPSAPSPVAAPAAKPSVAAPAAKPPAAPRLPEVAAVSAGEEALSGKGSCASA